MDREIVARKRDEIRQRVKRKFELLDKVKSKVPIMVALSQKTTLEIPPNTKGKVVFVGKWFDVYDVEFFIHGAMLRVGCTEDQILSA